MNLEEDIDVQCPFCFEFISIRIDSTAGESQEFVYDCEVCCRPINITAKQKTNGNFEINANT